MGVLVILEMDGDTDELLAAAADLHERRGAPPAMLAQIVAPAEGGALVCTLWESAEARDQYQSQPEHREALEASGLLSAAKGMRSRVLEDAESTLT